MKEYILCAAVCYQTSERSLHIHQPKNINNGIVICGRRHHNCFATVHMLDPTLKEKAGDIVQGFMTNTDRFVDRIEAAEIAKAANQVDELIITNKDGEETLISEDLY